MLTLQLSMTIIHKFSSDHVKASRGFCTVAGHNRARINVRASGSHWQNEKEILCSIPTC